MHSVRAFGIGVAIAWKSAIRVELAESGLLAGGEPRAVWRSLASSSSLSRRAIP
jgi:hypothetical protein